MTVTESRVVASLGDTIKCASLPLRRLDRSTGALPPARGDSLRSRGRGSLGVWFLFQNSRGVQNIEWLSNLLVCEETMPRADTTCIQCVNGLDT